MTLYAGEIVKVTHTALADSTPLAPEDITAVWITIWNADREVVVAETAMSWDAAKLRWQYLWQTTTATVGTYRARVRIEGVDGGSVWEYKRIRIARNPVEV